MVAQIESKGLSHLTLVIVETTSLKQSQSDIAIFLNEAKQCLNCVVYCSKITPNLNEIDQLDGLIPRLARELWSPRCGGPDWNFGVNQDFPELANRQTNQKSSKTRPNKNSNQNKSGNKPT